MSTFQKFPQAIKFDTDTWRTCQLTIRTKTLSLSVFSRLITITFPASTELVIFKQICPIYQMYNFDT